MIGYVGNTDYNWYKFFLNRGVDEVNFWRPGTTGLNLEPGCPFFFKLKAPYNAIAGFGFFAHFSRFPFYMAWETFEEGNGAETYREFHQRLIRYREKNKIRIDEPNIGCIMISQPVFFPREHWVEVPPNYKKEIVQGKKYDLSTSPGKELWQACLTNLELQNIDWEVHSDDSPKYKYRDNVPFRLGQGTFRVAVTDAYDRACAVSNEHSLPALEAAHIKPYSEGGEHSLSNGVLLRADIHRLYDSGYVGISPDHRFHVSQKLMDDFSNGRSYLHFDKEKITLPNDQTKLPSSSLLEWHMDQRFKK